MVKIRVMYNDGAKSEFIFGKPGTMYSLEDNVLKCLEKKDQDISFEAIRLSQFGLFKPINTLHDINYYMQNWYFWEYRTLFDSADGKKEEIMTVRVAKNIGEISKKTFGGVGTIICLRKVPGTDKTAFYADNKFLIHLPDPIETLKDLNDYIEYKMYPEYHTVFEEVKKGSGSVVVNLNKRRGEKRQ